MIRKLDLRSIMLIIIGAFLVALSINLIYEPLGMVTGGVSGLAIVIKSYSARTINYAIPVWVTNIVINVPLFIASYKIMGKRFIETVIGATLVFTFFLAVIPIIEFQSEDYFLASVFGSVLGGAGMGLIFMNSASIGGTDLLGTLIHQKLKHYSLARLLMIIDGAIVIIGAAEFGFIKASYAVVAVFITSKITDAIVEGGRFAKMVYIISEKDEIIAQRIIKDVDRGVTGLNAVGMYTKNVKNLLLCVVSRKEITKILEIIAEIDTNAFIILTDVREVHGEGFIVFDKKN